MLAALLPFLEAVIDESPAILADLAALLSRKQQQYASVLASVQAATADGAAALEATVKP